MEWSGPSVTGCSHESSETIRLVVIVNTSLYWKHVTEKKLHCLIIARFVEHVDVRAGRLEKIHCGRLREKETEEIDTSCSRCCNEQVGLTGATHSPAVWISISGRTKGVNELEV